MANEQRLIDANALCEFFQERYEYLRSASETPLPNGMVRVDAVIQGGAIIAKEFLDKAKNAPTVDAVEVVHGWRIPLEADGYADGSPVWDLWECSECRDEHSGDEDTLTPYCPNCGAKMDGGNEDG